MGWILFAALNAFFIVAVVVTWRSYSGSRKSHSCKAGCRREEVEIDPTDVPNFKPTWPNTK
jgi:hypothetical protein